MLLGQRPSDLAKQTNSANNRRVLLLPASLPVCLRFSLLLLNSQHIHQCESDRFRAVSSSLLLAKDGNSLFPPGPAPAARSRRQQMARAPRARPHRPVRAPAGARPPGDEPVAFEEPLQ